MHGEESDVHIPARARVLLTCMTVAKEINHMTSFENRSFIPAEVARKLLDAVLSGRGGNPEPNTPKSWATMVCGCHEAALTQSATLYVLKP